ncbi:hypothetical protein [Paraburkholderia phenoliruptrix]|uniref:hypothetical protein n=1 Tax=Paraburkholderia phenoliruptrix TaxID=252970 RepID=UPI001CB79CD2|nr:hypothetical protein [Paraburkholderia phenoliruptrix]
MMRPSRAESLLSNRSLELTLVDRYPRAYVLTEEGERIAERGRRMKEEWFAVERAEAVMRRDNRLLSV